MNLKPRLLVLSAAAGILVGASGLPAALAQQPQPQARNNCEPGDRVDGSTAGQAQKKMAAAGYANIHGLMKGCDNYWHALATQNGNPVRIVLSPAGQVMQEGD